MFNHVGMFSPNPFWFLIFVIEVRASNNQKQNTVTFQRGAEASSRLKRNKWGQPVGGNAYAGFELELGGAERCRKQETRDDAQSATDVAT
jgi:hypothetical protein